jgi:nucleoside-diphosphate-sugar epimerase
MSHSILLTGGSGYLGGTLLARLKRDELPKHKAIYALVRSTEQADAVKQYGVEPLHLDLDNQENLSKKLVELEITVVFFLIDAFNHGRQLKLIKALAQVKSKVESEVHFLHTTGAKIFSEHAGMPVDRTFSDNDPDLYNLQKTAKAPIIKAMDVRDAARSRCLYADGV